MDLKQAKFTQVVNNVEVISAADKFSRNASVSDTFQMPDVLHTGPGSRAELAAADGTITRVGANTVFSYDTANRTIDLQQGSLLFHSPHGKGGGTIRTGSATASVIGTTIIVTCTPNGGFKLLDLEGETEVRFLNGLKQHLEPGQMTFILPGGTQPSPIIIFRLDTQSKGSLLLNGFDHPLPSIARIDAEITQQLLEILNNRVGDTGLLVGNNATPNSVQVFQDLQTVNSQIHEQAFRNNNSGNSGNNSGGVTVTDGGSVITANDGNVTINGDETITASDEIWTGGVEISTGDTVIISPSFPVDGNVTIGASGDIDISDNTTIFSSDSINILADGNIDIENSTIEANNSFLITAPSGSITLNGDAVYAANSVDFSSGGDIIIDNSPISATAANSDSLSTSTGGTISISSGGTLTIAGQDGVNDFGYDFGADGSVTLSGTLGASISDALIKTLDGDPGDTVTVSSDGDISLQTSELDSDGLINLTAGGDIDLESSILMAGDSISITATTGSATLNGDTITAVNNSDITANTGITVSGTSITADPNVGTISLNNSSGVTTINNGSSMQAFYISVNSPDGILLDGTSGTISGNQLDLNSGNADGTDEIDVQNADLTSFATINMAAHTINLTSVAFGGASMVNLHSFFGLLAPLPNSGAASLPGFVNFITGVTYGGDAAENHVNPGSGPGIYISTLP